METIKEKKIKDPKYNNTPEYNKDTTTSTRKNY